MYVRAQINRILSVSLLLLFGASIEARAETGFSLKANDDTAVTGAGFTAVPPFQITSVPSSATPQIDPSAFLVCPHSADVTNQNSCGQAQAQTPSQNSGSTTTPRPRCSGEQCSLQRGRLSTLIAEETKVRFTLKRVVHRGPESLAVLNLGDVISCGSVLECQQEVASRIASSERSEVFAATPKKSVCTQKSDGVWWSCGEQSSRSFRSSAKDDAAGGLQSFDELQSCLDFSHASQVAENEPQGTDSTEPAVSGDGGG